MLSEARGEDPSIVVRIKYSHALAAIVILQYIFSDSLPFLANMYQSNIGPNKHAVCKVYIVSHIHPLIREYTFELKWLLEEK